MTDYTPKKPKGYDLSSVLNWLQKLPDAGRNLALALMGMGVALFLFGVLALQARWYYDDDGSLNLDLRIVSVSISAETPLVTRVTETATASQTPVPTSTPNEVVTYPTLTAIASQRATPAPTVPVACAFPYVPGINYPWHRYGLDFGVSNWGHSGITTRVERVRSEFAYLQQHEVKVIRWFLFADGRAAPDIDTDGHFSFDGKTFADIDRALALAEQYDLQIVFVLFDHNLLARAEIDGPTQMYGRANWVTDEAIRANLLAEAVQPLLVRYGQSDVIAGWEVMNEPEAGMAVPGGWFWSYTYPEQPIIDLHAEVVALVQRWTQHPAILGSTNVALMQSDRWAGIPFDIRTHHYYDWMRSEPAWAIDTPAEVLADVPVVLGEFPTANSRQSITGYLDNTRQLGYASAWPWSLVADDNQSDFRAVAEQYAEWHRANPCEAQP